jgi:hypothetical protein
MAIVFADGHSDYFIQAQTPGQKLVFQEFETDAHAAFVSVKNDKPVKAMLAGGTSLTQDGKPVAAEIKEITDLSKTPLTHKF